MSAAVQYKQAVKQEVSISDFIPYSSQVTENIVKLKSGDYVATIRLQGAAHESADAQDINIWHDRLNQFFCNISSPKVALWSHVVRREAGEYPGGQFAPGFAHDLNAKYKKYVAEQSSLVNELYVSIVYRPVTDVLSKWTNVFGKNNELDAATRQHEELESFRDILNTALSSLERYEPELLGCYEHRGQKFSEIREFLAFLVDGEWRRAVIPQGDMSELLATSRPFFGKGGLLSLKGPARTQYGAILCIQGYPSVTVPGLFNELLSMPFELVLSQSFTFLSKPVALGRMNRQQSRMVNAGDVATSQVAAIEEAMDMLASDRYVMGAHNFGLVIKATSHKELNNFVSDAGASLSDSGVKWAREDAGIAGAFFAQLPGNFEFRVRIADITSRNFAGLSCFHNYPTGRIKGNQWGDAVAMFRTSSGAPYYFNFHKGEDGALSRQTAKVDPNHKELANTVVIGPSGSGKTVLETFLLSSVLKFNQPPAKRLSAVLFDKDLGAAVAVRAMGGKYYPLKVGQPSGFAPLQMEPTATNLAFIEKLIRKLVLRSDKPFTTTEENDISSAVRTVMGSPKTLRRLRTLLQILPHGDPDGLHARLSRWAGPNAPLGWLFDNAVDTMSINDAPVVGFDVTEFLPDDEVRTPTIMYLFHRIESLLDGRRVPIFMDEFGQLLNDPAFEDLSKNKLVTIRKQDGFLVMFTQSPKQVIQNKIAFAIIEQTATKIFLPNPAADEEDYCGHFKLTLRELQIIRELGEKSRQFLIKQGKNSVVAELNLRGFEDEIAVLSGNTATSALAERLVAEFGDDPAVWLPEFQRLRHGV